MPDSEMSSRERMLAALTRREPDRVPCSFMLFGGLQSGCADYAEFIERQVEMGLDAFVELPLRPPVVVDDHHNLHGLPVRYDPRVSVSEWIERPAGERWPVLVKEYHTPAGALRAEVRQTEDWPWGDHVPFLDDHIVPRSRKFLITQPGDLAALRYLLAPPSGDLVTAFRNEARVATELARRHGLLVTGGWGVGADLLGWVFGLQNMIYATHDAPGFVREMLELVAAWNQQRMRVVIGGGVDLYIKRAWYENCDFWTPATYREFLLPLLKADADLAHQEGALFGYIITSNCMPLLELIAEAGVDVVIGVDPREWDLAAARQVLGGRVCMWGGVNGHVTVEQGAPEEVRAEVRRAMEVLAPGGGFILSPVDNVRADTARARGNVLALLDEWRRLRPRPATAGA